MSTNTHFTTNPMMRIFDPQVYKKLTKAEKSLVEKININPEVITANSIAQAAKIFDVSNPTITRLAHKLGFVKFNDLRMHVAERLNESKDFQVLGTGILCNIIHDSITYNTFGIKQTLQDANNIKTIENLAEKLFKYRKIYIFGYDGNSFAASNFSTLLTNIGLNTVLMTNVYIGASRMVAAKPTDALIVFANLLRISVYDKILSYAESKGMDIWVISAKENHKYNKIVIRKHIVNEMLCNASVKNIQQMIVDAIHFYLIKKNPELGDFYFSSRALVSK